MSQKKIISTQDAPQAIGPYSQAIKAGNTVYFSGQIPLDPSTMKLIEGTFEDRAHRVFKNISAVAQAAGGSLSDLVKVNIYLTDLGQFSSVNNVMEKYFKVPFPARAAIGVKDLPLGCDIEIEAIMVL